MKVFLISHTPDLENLIYSAARTCYSPLPVSEMKIPDDKTRKNMLQKLISSGHESPLEHVTFSFSIEGVSRALSHQLVRHRAGVSFSQQSQRYVRFKDRSMDAFVTPKSILDNEESRKVFENALTVIMDAYDQLIEIGGPDEDARFILPNAAKTNLVCTFNIRALFHFFELRMCERAQWEIRELASEMRKCCMEVAPEIFKFSGASCDVHGFCPEGEMSCGKCPEVRWRRESV